MLQFQLLTSKTARSQRVCIYRNTCVGPLQLHKSLYKTKTVLNDAVLWKGERRWWNKFLPPVPMTMLVIWGWYSYRFILGTMGNHSIFAASMSTKQRTTKAKIAFSPFQDAAVIIGYSSSKNRLGHLADSCSKEQRTGEKATPKSLDAALAHTAEVQSVTTINQLKINFSQLVTVILLC